MCHQCKCKICIHPCKSLWIKASAKWLNVNVSSNLQVSQDAVVLRSFESTGGGGRELWRTAYHQVSQLRVTRVGITLILTEERGGEIWNPSSEEEELGCHKKKEILTHSPEQEQLLYTNTRGARKEPIKVLLPNHNFKDEREKRKHYRPLSCYNDAWMPALCDFQRDRKWPRLIHAVIRQSRLLELR